MDNLTGATTKIRCVNAWYEDDDGYIQNVGIYAGDLSEDQIIEGLYESGMIYVSVWDEYEKEIPTSDFIRNNYQPGSVMDVFDVDDEVIEAFAEEHGLDPEEYKHVGFFESAKTEPSTESLQCDWKARAKSFLNNDLFVDFD